MESTSGPASRQTSCVCLRDQGAEAQAHVSEHANGPQPANSYLELCSGHLRVDGNTTPTNSTKTTMTNQRTSMPFQAFTNGIPLALVNAHFGCKLSFGVEAMPMTFRICRSPGRMP